MKIKELVTEKGSIFSYIYPSIFSYNLNNKLLESLDSDSLDKTFIALHGEKEISQFTKSFLSEPELSLKEPKEKTIESIANSLYVLYGEKWNNALAVLTSELPLDTYKLVTTEKIDSKGNVITDSKEDNNTTTKDNYAGFNGTEVYGSDEVGEDYTKESERITTTNNKGNSAINTTDNKERITEISGYQGNIVEDRQKLMVFINNNLFIDTVFKDIARTIGKLIY
mgnify:CR=1 FL=1